MSEPDAVPPDSANSPAGAPRHLLLTAVAVGIVAALVAWLLGLYRGEQQARAEAAESVRLVGMWTAEGSATTTSESTTMRGSLSVVNAGPDAVVVESYVLAGRPAEPVGNQDPILPGASDRMRARAEIPCEGPVDDEIRLAVVVIGPDGVRTPREAVLATTGPGRIPEHVDARVADVRWLRRRGSAACPHDAAGPGRHRRRHPPQHW